MRLVKVSTDVVKSGTRAHYTDTVLKVVLHLRQKEGEFNPVLYTERNWLSDVVSTPIH